MKLATVYKRKNTFFMHASSKTTDGVWILSEPCSAVSEEADVPELQRVLRTALDGSHTGVPHPRVWKGLLDPLLHLAGVKTWSAFVKGTLCVRVEEEGERVVLIPARNLGPKEGFEDDTSKQVVLEGDAATDALGATVRRLLAESA